MNGDQTLYYTFTDEHGKQVLLLEKYFPTKLKSSTLQKYELLYPFTQVHPSTPPQESYPLPIPPKIEDMQIYSCFS